MSSLTTATVIAGDPGGLGAAHAEEAQRVRHWATVLDLEAQSRNRSARRSFGRRWAGPGCGGSMASPAPAPWW